MKHIGIIGGGFSGTLTAVNLSRRATGPLKISIINDNYPLGRGIAYSTRNGSHLLNVAARNMSALADQPTHFVEWLRTRSEYVDEPLAKLRERFVPRRIYGDYLQSLLFLQTCAAAEKGVVIEKVPHEATDVIPTADGARIMLSNGETLDVTKVVLATGNPAPSRLNLKGIDSTHPKCFQNPWGDWESKLTDRTENVILVGTGLTAIDVFLSMKDLGWKGKIFAVSRNGLLPLSHFKGTEYPEWLNTKSEKITLAKAYKAFKKLYREARSQGVNPAILVDKLRPITQELWQNLSLIEKRRFNRHFRTRWNVVRHRIAQSIHQQMLEAIASHRLEIVRGRLWQVNEVGDQLLVTLKVGNSFRRIEAGALINCTGPSESYSQSSSKIYESLLCRGLAKADQMNMGIDVTDEFEVIDQSGKASGVVFAVGPMLKGTLWESSAVPELRSQAFRVAEVIARQLYGVQPVALPKASLTVQEYEI